jgi:hypothetical protein
MLTPLRLFRLINELIFVLLGALLLWLAATGRYFFDPRRPAWLVLGAVLVFWGVRLLMRTGRYATLGGRAVEQIRGASLAVVGALMISLAWMSLRWAGVLLGAAGGILILRGLASAALSLRKA